MDTDFLTEALKRFEYCSEATNKIRESFVDDLKFLNGKQWDDTLLESRLREKRPALTINKLPATHNIIVNDFRQNRPTIKFRPVDDLTDPDKADVVNGLLRRIQNNGDSRAAIDTAFYYAVAGGFGFIRVSVDYANESSFDQDIFLEKIDNPCSVYFPFTICKTADYSDAPYCFIRTKIQKEEFESLYPDSTMSSFDNYGTGDNKNLWSCDKDEVYICEYFYTEDKNEYIILLDNGDIVFAEEKPKIGQVLPNTDFIIKNFRSINKKTVKRAIINRFEVLEKPVEIPSGGFIPIVPMIAQEVNIEGEKEYISLIRNAKDPQKMFNFWNSAFTEQIALAPKVPWLIAEGQIEGYERYWHLSNVKNFSYLPYKPVTLAGNPVPPPMRTAPPEVGSAIITGIQYASDNLKSTTNIFDASLGARSNETSGKAILARQRQGSTANFHYTDNAARCLRQVGRIIKNLIPVIYDTPNRVIRIIGEDMSDKVFKLNRENPDPKGNLYDMRVGEYDIIVDTGASYETKRIEMTETLTALAQSNPIFSQITPDLLIQSLDFAGKDDIAKRMKKFLKMQYPDLIEDDTDESAEEKALQEAQAQTQQLNQQLQQAQAQLQQDKEQLQQMNEVIQKLSAELQNLQIANKNKESDLAVKVQIEKMKSEIEIMKMQTEIQKTLLTEKNKRDIKEIEIGGDLAKNAQQKMLNMTIPVNKNNNDEESINKIYE